MEWIISPFRKVAMTVATGLQSADPCLHVRDVVVFNFLSVVNPFLMLGISICSIYWLYLSAFSI